MPKVCRNYVAATKADIDRFMAKVQPDLNSGCWLWAGAQNGKGYGVFSLKTGEKWGPIYAHRFSYVNLISPVAADADLDHKCRTRCCVNPAHLEPVTRRENLSRSPFNLARRNRCNYGHPFTEATSGSKRKANGVLVRYCRECDRLSHAARRARTKSHGEENTRHSS